MRMTSRQFAAVRRRKLARHAEQEARAIERAAARAIVVFGIDPTAEAAPAPAPAAKVTP